MTGTLYQQVITILTIPPGNLVYHLVLAFSIAGTLPGALNLWQRAGSEVGKRMVLGLSLLLLGQFILVLDAGLAQFFPLFADWLPVLDRAVNTYSLVILIWLWVFPNRHRSADYAALLLGSLTMLLLVITGLWWLNLPSTLPFNSSPPDMIWSGLSLLLAITGGLLSIIRRQPGYGIGLSMFALLFVGQFLYIIYPLPPGNFPGIVRLTHITAFPLLLTLPSRFSLEADSLPDESLGIKSTVFDQITLLATTTQFDRVCQASTSLVSHALSADIVLMVSPPDAKQNINLHCGYNLINQEPVGSAIFGSQIVPVLAESLRQRRPLHLPAQGNIPDLEGIGKILDLPVSGSLLSAPIITSSGDADKALVLLSSASNRRWTAADQNYLADIAQSLGKIFEYKALSQVYESKYSELNDALGNLRSENEHLIDQQANLSSRERDLRKQLSQLQTKLALANQEIARLKDHTSVDQVKEGKAD